MKESKLLEIIESSVKDITEDNEDWVLKKIKGYITDFEIDGLGSNLLFVYGDLRKDQFYYNKLRKQFGKDKIQYLDTLQFEYVWMYDMDTYPVIRDDDSYISIKDIVIGDLIYVSDEVFNYIDKFQREGGFTPSPALIWCKDSKSRPRIKYFTTYKAGKNLLKQIKEDKDKYPKVEGGDWVRYQTSASPVIPQETETEVEKNCRIQRAYEDYYGECY